jgi:hypothetical protein
MTIWREGSIWCAVFEAATELGLAPMGELLTTVEQGWEDLVGRFERKWCLVAWEQLSPRRVSLVPEPRTRH